MRKKLFVISDMHGHYTETIHCLSEAGWDENNPDHLLISLGDAFDRGTESVALYKWLYRLNKEGKAVALRGNHTAFTEEYLEWDSYPFNYINNGVSATFDDFLGRTRAFESYCLFDKECEMTVGNFAYFMKEARAEINENYPELLPWLKSLPYYYETQNYIFTHASIDTKATDWHIPHYTNYTDRVDWAALVWDDGSFLGAPMHNTQGKTVVVGHFHTYALRHRYGMSNIDDPYNIKADHSILEVNDAELGHKIFIDGCVPVTKKVNVLVIENEKLLEERKVNNEVG